MPHIPDNPESHGLLNVPKEYKKLGAIIPYIVRNPSGIWETDLPDGELQYGKEDSMACVSYSLKHCIESQEFFLTGKKIRYSARWLAKASGTTKQGNYLMTVAETVQTLGLVKEESWPTPKDFTWDQYYAEPTPIERAALLAEGQEWLKTHKLEVEWLNTSQAEILKHLQQCPLQVTIPGHAIENYELFKPQDVVDYFDTYMPFEKKTSRSNLVDVFKPLLTMKLMRLVNDSGTYYLVGDKGKIGLADIGVLNKLKEIETVEEVGSTTGIPAVGIFETGFTFHR